MGPQKRRNARMGAGTAISRGLVNDCVRYAAALDLLYLNNPKCGCTTIKHALWLAIDAVSGKRTLRGSVHNRKTDPFAKNLFRLSATERARVARATVFSVVRNPYARALSAYVNKVNRDPAVWPVFLKRVGLKPHVGQNELPFGDFLGLVGEADDDILDGHFRPQCCNLLFPLAKPVFVGFVEAMTSVGEFLEKRGIGFRDEKMNATGAWERMSHFYDAKAVARVRTRYAEDFAAFGYATDIARVDDAPAGGALSFGSAGEDRLLHWLATGEPPEGASRERRGPSTAFGRTSDAEKKLRIVRRTFEQEHNWSTLQRYANFAKRRAADRALRDAILERMTMLRTRYLKTGADPDIFVDLR